MGRKLFSLFAALLFTSVVVPTAWGALADLGIPIAPHGYPAWYQDSTGLRLELCVPPPAGNASLRPDLCIFDPLEFDADGNPVNPLVVTGESFWWMASTSVAVRGGGDGFIEFALEGTFGGTEEPIDGQQISFGRTRIRIDTPVAGTYKIIHPYGTQDFVVADPAGGINYTADIGAANFLSPASGFYGALAAFGPNPVPFLTWPDYANNENLKVRGPSNPLTGELGPVLEQYVGNPNVASAVVGGPNGNVFRIEGPPGSNLDGLGNDFVETANFFVMGKVFDTTVELVAHAYPVHPEPNLFAVGPVNRVGYFADPLSGTPLVAVAGPDLFSDRYSLGYPLWYQEKLPVIDPETGEQALDPETNQLLYESSIGGLRLTLCTPGDPMCISDPINLANEAQRRLFTGGEGFWWSADASFDVGDDRFVLVLGIEATFGGDESIVDGQQISFGRERIRFDFDNDLPAGTHTYRVTHPYGVRIMELPASETRRDRIRFVADIGIADPADPDSAHVGTLYSTVGPTFLKWTTFVDPATLADGTPYPEPQLVTPHIGEDGNPTGLLNYHVGNPGVLHEVTGSPFGTNYFRVEKLTSGTIENGNWQLIGQTNLFAVSGKVFDQRTFAFAINEEAPQAFADTATLTISPQVNSITINVLANDQFRAPATVTVLPAGATFGPENGAAVANPDGTVTYTPSAAFVAVGGVDTFAYQITDDTGLTSGNAVVTVTVVPAEAISVSRATLQLRRLRLNIGGTSNLNGSRLTIYSGDAAIGTPIAQDVLVNNGRWTFRGTSQVNPDVNTITVINPATGTSITQPLQVR